MPETACPYCGQLASDTQEESAHMRAAHRDVIVKRLRDTGRHAEAEDFERKHGADVSEAVNHPEHYGGEGNPYECILVIEAWNLDFCLGNAIKYISRAGKKGDAVEDLKKAAWYLQRRIKQLEAEHGT